MDSNNFSLEAVARHWDDNAEIWADHVNRGWDRAREDINNPAFFALVGDVSGKDVLDAGCGEGYNTRLFARKGARMTGFDISEKMIRFAREAEEKESLGIRYEIASAGDISIFTDESFDVVVSTMMLMDNPDLPGTFKEFYRVMRPGGMLCFSILHPCFVPPKYEWIKDEEGTPIKLCIAEYFNTEPFVERWKFSKAQTAEDVRPFAVPSYHRPISEYINTIIKSGFTLAEVREARPSEEACKKDPSLLPFRIHASWFLQFKAEKK